MFQKILFYFTVIHNILYEKFHDSYTSHILVTVRCTTVINNMQTTPLLTRCSKV